MKSTDYLEGVHALKHWNPRARAVRQWEPVEIDLSISNERLPTKRCRSQNYRDNERSSDFGSHD